MGEWVEQVLQWLLGVPPWAAYTALGTAAAVENVIPPVPADVVVFLGGLLAGYGGATAVGVFVVVWLCNVLGALAIYVLGWRTGRGFFEGRWGQLLLRPGQLASLGAFYDRYGIWVVFFSRFLPMFRAVVPVFAGVIRLSPARTVPALAAASALWYGAIVYLGSVAGRNWERILSAISSSGRWFWIAALVALVGVGWWWHRSR